MSIQILRDLRGLRIEIVHPPDPEGSSLVEHCQRIGCAVSAAWPVPPAFASATDIVIMAIDHDSRHSLRRLLAPGDTATPTLLAVVGYENPSILQLVLESGVHAVIERPVRPFGLLTNLALARSLWLAQQEARSRIHKLERKLLGAGKLNRAKSILMATEELSEDAAYQRIRRQAMSRRTSMEEMADCIISANHPLKSRLEDD